ncbi:MAG: hypothetical protein KGQ60_16515 [Planctomycetes bacterium]|nr:hypothetical protein [Planctomycetota bacterium]
MIDVFRIIEVCAAIVDLRKCKMIDAEFRVFRPDEGIDSDMISISRIEDALPLGRGEDVFLQYQNAGREALSTLHLSLRGVGDDAVSRIDIESSVHVNGDSTSPDFDIQKQQYSFAKLLHYRLEADVTLGYADENEESPDFRFGSEPLLLPAFEVSEQA